MGMTDTSAYFWLDLERLEGFLPDHKIHEVLDNSLILIDSYYKLIITLFLNNPLIKNDFFFLLQQVEIYINKPYSYLYFYATKNQYLTKYFSRYKYKI